MKKIVCLVGKTGSGKSTIETELEKTQMFQKLVSVTTREPREGEEYGEDYYFTTKELFQGALDDGYFIEHEEHYGTMYGLLKEEVEEVINAGKFESTHAVLVINYQGYLTIKKHYPDNTLLFYVEAKLEDRISKALKRGTPGLQQRVEEDEKLFDEELIKKECIAVLENKFDQRSLTENIMKIINELYKPHRISAGMELGGENYESEISGFDIGECTQKDISRSTVK